MKNLINTILNHFKAVKLTNSYFRSSFKVQNEILSNISKDELDYKVKMDFINSFSSYIYNQHNSAIKITKEPGEPFTRYELDLFVFKKEDFTIINALIKEIYERENTKVQRILRR